MYVENEETKSSRRPGRKTHSPEAASASDRLFEQVKRELARHKERLTDLRDQAAFVFGFSRAAEQIRSPGQMDDDAIESALRRATDEEDDLLREIEDAKRQPPGV